MFIKVNRENSIWFVNVGEKPKAWIEKNKNIDSCCRKWEDSLQHGYITAGQGVKWKEQIEKVKIGDIVCAYLTGYGFVGIGICKESAMAVKELILLLKINVNLLRSEKKYPKHHNILWNAGNLDLQEYGIVIEWQKTVSREKSKRYGKGITQHVVCEMSDDKINFIKREFDVEFVFDA